MFSKNMLVLFCCIFVCNVAERGVAASTFSGYVTKVIDGDSLLVESGGTTREVRLWGVDCPEYTQPYAADAKRISRSLMERKKVTVRVHAMDKYDRYVGVVMRNGTIVNEELVRVGAAWVYRRYCRDEVCTRWEDLERDARIRGIGLWSNRDAIAPWTWRRRN